MTKPQHGFLKYDFLCIQTLALVFDPRKRNIKEMEPENSYYSHVFISITVLYRRKNQPDILESNFLRKLGSFAIGQIVAFGCPMKAEAFYFLHHNISRQVTHAKRNRNEII